MKTSQELCPQLEFDKIYHVFNQGNNGELLFRNRADYLLFLEKYKRFIGPVADTFCYVLLPNHFHFLIRIKSWADIKEFYQAKEILPEQPHPDFVNRPFSNFFNSFSRCMGIRYQRSGKLFSLPYKRIEVEDEFYFTQLIYYIHRNPIHHKWVKDFPDWEFSSFSIITNDKPTFLEKYQVINWFGGKSAYLDYHQDNLKLNFPRKWRLE